MSCDYNGQLFPNFLTLSCGIVVIWSYSVQIVHIFSIKTNYNLSSGNALYANKQKLAGSYYFD